MPVYRSAPVQAAALASAVLLATACGPADEETGRAGAPQVRIAVNGWVGYHADAAVVSYLLEEELGYQVELVEADEEASWRGLADGSVDVILENWGHEDLMELYGATERPLVVDGGPTGNDGRIGWYLPEYLAEEHPGIDTVDGLRGKENVFAEDGEGTGRLLAADPSFVTQDQGMINHFGLDLEIEHAGSEEEQIERVREAYEKEEPVLFYFYEPQWLFEDLDLVKVEFPEYVELCEIDPDDVGCDYPDYELNKVFSAAFADTGGPAHEFIENWTWSNEDQNEVARMIAEEGEDPQQAARTWVEENPDVWREWLPEQN
ncbi:glycine betaine ABC transporter substrate-binding protein [Nocardiopsis composta]|uniref:Glycine betaine/proline transport system substrate-binding protein n=1 Tax=Nocardiopsis composta TaxID=157465 RepID=A0A7W8QPR9_9ACTN|nr:glycine betaine ABC transporter substrate-binding protein [Nocardiopsis composta]MBB5433341.1 glycine betaine/proline transport system substrate-binding protein [Nocardiopsis composta]